MGSNWDSLINGVCYLLVTMFFVLLVFKIGEVFVAWGKRALHVLQETRARRASQQERESTQVGLEQCLRELPIAKDFRRAAKVAAQAWGSLSPATLQEIFWRHRGSLIDFYAERSRSGAIPEELRASLDSLIRELAIPPFEADYIVVEAGQRPNPQVVVTPTETFAQEVQDLEREHIQRLAGLGGLQMGDPDVRDRLVERETNRFVTKLMALFEDDRHREGD